MMRWLLRSITGDRYPIRLIHPMIKRHKHGCMAFYQLMLRAKIMIAVYCRWTWRSGWRWWWGEGAKLTEAAYLFQITPSLPTALTYPLMGGPNPQQKSLLIHHFLGNREIFENLTISGSCPYPQLSWACYALYPINQGVISEIHPQNISVPFPRGVLKVSKFAFPKPRRSCLLYPLTHTCYFSSPLGLQIHCWI